MKRMSVTRLVKMPAAQINHFYRNPTELQKFTGLHPVVLAAGKNTTRYLCMSTQVEYRGKELYITFDEVIIKDGTAYCIMRKTARPEHLNINKLIVGMMGAAFELGNKRLSTVRRLTEAGYRLHRVNLADLPRVYVLDYHGRCFDIVADEPMCLHWMKDKLNAANNAEAARAFDLATPPDIYTWDMVI